jgi:hypothetical protein
MLIRGMGSFQLSALQAAAKAAGGSVVPAMSASQGVPLAVMNAGSGAAAAHLASSLLLTGAAPQPGSAAAGAQLAVAQLLPLAGVADIPMPPPAPVVPPNVAGGGSLPSTGPAVPAAASVAFTIGGAVPPTYTGNTKGPNETALDAAMAAAGVTTDDQAATWLSSLDGQPAPQFLNETSSAYYLAILAKKQQEAKYLKWGIVGAGVLGLALLLK